MTTPRKNEKGFVLMTTYLLMAALAIFSLALFSRSAEFIKSSDRNKKKMVAFNLAEAGVDKAYYDLKNGAIASFPYTGSYTSMNSGSVQGGYQTTVTDMGGGVKKVVVVGYSPSQSSTTESVESRTVTGYVQTPTEAAFNFGVFAKTSMTFNGNPTVDSYNSDNGAYSSGSAGSNGDIATDSTTAGAVSLVGNATVKGDAITGVGSTPASVVSITGGSASITGSKTAASTAQNPQTMTTSTASSGALSISGSTTVTLSAGTYNYSSLSISGSGRLTATGAVKIYVSGAVSIAGNGISTSSSAPPNMIIYVTGSDSVAISGNAALYAGVYAPNSAVSKSGNGQLYGAVVANTFTQSGNANLHYDEALQDVASDSTETSMLSWNESGLINS